MCGIPAGADRDKRRVTLSVKALLFDIGGTLLHYHDPKSKDLARPFRRVTLLGVEEVVRQMASSGAVLPPANDIVVMVDRHIGMSFPSLLEKQLGGSIETPVRAAFSEMGITIPDSGWEALRPAFYSAINRIVLPRVGGPETLAKLHNTGIRLGVISNTFWAADLHDRHLADH